MRTRTVCRTKYPIVLVHGLGFRDRKYLNYWGRIPKVLARHGASVFHGNQDSHGSIESNAQQLGDQIDRILAKTGAQKVNVIAHSKGGLDARYLISVLGYEGRVASLTTIATPHHGSKTMDKLLRVPRILVRAVAVVSNGWYRLLGDETPDTMTLFFQLSTPFAAAFNEIVTDCEGVYYQSFAFVMDTVRSDVFLALPHAVVRRVEGENDGLVSTQSAQWTNFRGVVRGTCKRGISHCDEVDMRRRRLSKTQVAERVSDVVLFYRDVVHELKGRGL